MIVNKWIGIAAVASLAACASDKASEGDASAPGAQAETKDDGHGGHHGGHHAKDGDKSYTPGEHKHAHHSFDDADKWAARFEDPSRDEWQQPEQVLDWLALEPGDKVADIGAATGYFPVRIAKRVPDGKVYGVDIEPNMVTYLNERAQKEGIGNLEAVLGEPADPKIPEPVDVVLLVNTYHHIEQREAYFKQLLAQTTPTATLAIVDFKPGELEMGPPPEMKLAADVVEKELAAAGWKKSAEHELEMQYVLVFSRADAPEG